jgi:hypothetical protein
MKSFAFLRCGHHLTRVCLIMRRNVVCEKVKLRRHLALRAVVEYARFSQKSFHGQRRNSPDTHRWPSLTAPPFNRAR